MDGLVWLLMLIVIFNLVVGIAKPGSGTPLTEYISHYEPLNYDIQQLQQAHHRAKRSADHEVQLRFSAHGRSFSLRLHHDTGVFHPDVQIETSHDTLHYDTSHAYIGHLYGEDGSRVHGIITVAGIFEGKIVTPSEIYVVQGAHHFFPIAQPFHSVMYRHSHIHMPTLNATLCTADKLHRKLKLQMADATKRTRKSDSSMSGLGFFRHSSLKQSIGTTPADAMDNMYSTQRPREGQQQYKHLHRRHKRAIDPSKTTCTLYVQADHLFFQKFHSNPETVIEQLTQHVQGVNDIYRIIDFDDDGLQDSINFIIKRVKVHTDSATSDYKFPGNYGVETFLELFSEDNFDAFCLAYMFTYRDFEGGTLGLAWTGDLQNAGGVCEKNGQFRGSLKSLNSGIVTILNYGKDVPSAVSHVTMAHEIGHNMGSQHDPETVECSPGGEPGNYIMFARATSGDKPNNNKFSACSKASMATVMEAKARHTLGCFIAPTSSICGNEVVEAGEECDCGWEDECTDLCCHPQTPGTSGHQRPCTRRSGAACSPSEGPCCTDRCRVIGPPLNKTCREASACKEAAFCDGSGPGCPFSRQKGDKTSCDDGYVCYQGECTGSICVAYALESCQCEPTQADNYKDPSLCELCCKEPGEGHPCISSFEWNKPPFDVPDLMAKPGTPCNNYKGYCDVFQKCREVDPKGPLANLKKLIFSSEGIRSMKEWLVNYWYIVLVAGIGFVLFLALFIKVCSPKKKKNPVTPMKLTKPVAQVQRTLMPPSQTQQQPWMKRNTRNAKTPTAPPLPPPSVSGGNYNLYPDCPPSVGPAVRGPAHQLPLSPTPGQHSGRPTPNHFLHYPSYPSYPSYNYLFPRKSQEGWV